MHRIVVRDVAHVAVLVVRPAQATVQPGVRWLVGLPHRLSHQPGFDAPLQPPHVHAPGGRLVLEHQYESLFASKHLDKELQEAVEDVAFVAVSQRFDVDGVPMESQTQPRLDAVNRDHPQYPHNVALHRRLIVVGKVRDDAVHGNWEAQDDERASRKPSNQMCVGSVRWSSHTKTQAQMHACIGGMIDGRNDGWIDARMHA
mmetsp:Transcript_20102/g.57031  ORF Transcript_20102/g.57031 Transcript_20102/m.57031 type:complete len:201 (-) Transcript_20102:318-920(-)